VAWLDLSSSNSTPIKLWLQRVPVRGRNVAKNQKENSSLFKYAVAYAKSIIKDPEKKAEYAKKLKKNASVYHAAIREFLITNGFQNS
jgi:hypothetical protein